MLFSPQILVRNLPKIITGGGGLGLQTSLSAFFSLDDLTEATGAVTDLTNNNIATFVAGKVGNCVNTASASSQSLTHASVAALQLSNADFSVQAWVNIGGGGNSIVGKFDGAFGNREWQLRLVFGTGNRFRFDMENSSGSVKTLTANTFGNLSNSTWYHVVCTYNFASDTMKIYVNGSLSDSTTFGSTKNFTSTSNFFIGGYTGNFFDGKTDQVGYWKGRELSSSDVTALYNSGSGLSYAAMA